MKGRRADSGRGIKIMQRSATQFWIIFLVLLFAVATVIAATGSPDEDEFKKVSSTDDAAGPAAEHTVSPQPAVPPFIPERDVIGRIPVAEAGKMPVHPIMLNVKGAKFGEVIRCLAKMRPFNYSICPSALPSASLSSPLSPASAGSPGNASAQAMPVGPMSRPLPGAQPQMGLYDINVSFAYTGDSIDDAVAVLCKGADVYCEKKDGIWMISKHETYIIDKDVFFTYSISNGAGSASSSPTTQPPSTGTSGIQPASSSSSSSGPSTTGASGTDSISMTGNFDDFATTFIKSFLSSEGTVQISKSGYIVVDDVPSAIARIRRVIAKDKEMAGVKLKVDVIRVDLTDNYSAGVNWNAVIKNATISGTFAPAGAFNFGYNTTKGGNPITTLLGVLGTYGDSKVVKTWDAYALNGTPVFFNDIQEIPYFTQSQAITTGISSTTTQVNYISVGLKIKILPNIRRDVLNGGVYAELSELVSMQSSGGTNPTTAPLTSVTNTALPLELKWGNSFVLTGFKSNQNSITASGIPWLSKLPIFGALFGSQEKGRVGSEFAIVVTATKTDKEDKGDVKGPVEGK